MICEHLHPLEKELTQSGITELFRGQLWSNNCREWVYYDCLFPDLDKTIDRFQLDRSVVYIHSHLGTHDGHEHGLVCKQCWDGIMGMHPEMLKRGFSSVTEFE